MLETMPDEILAEKLDRSVTSIRVKRNRLGIHKEVATWSAPEDALLALPPMEAARPFGIHTTLE
jgi:hypothetical protein